MPDSDDPESTDEGTIPVTDRTHSTFYLCDKMITELDLAFNRTGLAIAEEAPDLKLEKNRHFRPLVLLLGLEQLETMTTEEIIHYLDNRDQLDSISRG